MSAAIPWVPLFPCLLNDYIIFFLFSPQYFLPHPHSQLMPLLPTSLKKNWNNQKRSPTDSSHGYPPPRTLYSRDLPFLFPDELSQLSSKASAPVSPRSHLHPVLISAFSTESSPLHTIVLVFLPSNNNRTKQTQKTAFEVLLLSSCWPISLLPFIAKFLERFICSFVSFLLSLSEMYSNSASSLTMPLKLLLPGLYFPCCSVQLSGLRPHLPESPAAFDRVDPPFFFEDCSLLSF